MGSEMCIRDRNGARTMNCWRRAAAMPSRGRTGRGVPRAPDPHHLVDALTGALPQLPESHRQALGGQSENADENAEQHEHRRAVKTEAPGNVKIAPFPLLLPPVNLVLRNLQPVAGD